MPALSDTLKAMKFNAVSPKAQPPGSMTTAGKPIIPFAQAATSTAREIEKSLLASLESLSTLQIVKKETGIYSENGAYLTTRITATIARSSPDDIAVARARLHDFLQPAKPEFIYQKLAKLRSLTAMRSAHEIDITARLGAYCGELRNYPAHAISFACKELVSGGWFPDKIQDFHDLIIPRIALAQNLLNQLDPANFEQPKRIETKTWYRDVPRAQWQPCHLLEKIQDLIAAADACAKHHQTGSELGMLLAAQKFAAEARAKFDDANPDMQLIYQLTAQLSPRIATLESRLAAKDEAQAQAHAA